MVGSIDPRCETLRGTHWPVKVAGVFGTRVAENHLGQRFKATASTGRTYGCKRSDQTLKNSCGTGAVHIRVLVATLTLLVSSAASAQECKTCSMADACIKTYLKAASEAQTATKQAIRD